MWIYNVFWCCKLSVMSYDYVFTDTRKGHSMLPQSKSTNPINVNSAVHIILTHSGGLKQIASITALLDSTHQSWSSLIH